VAGIVVPDGELSFTLQSGQQATIYLAPLPLKPGATCEPKAVGGDAITASQYFQPFLLGQTTATIKSGNQSITIDANYSAVSPRIDDCNFGKSGSGGNGGGGN